MRSGIKKKHTENKNQGIIFKPDEIVDIINEKEKETYEGKIIAIKGDLIVVQNLNKNKEENYSIKDNKVLKQWKPTRPLQKYNRIDLELSNTNYWVEANVIDIDKSKNKILVKYKNSNRFKKACEEWINLDSDKNRICYIGYYTKSENQNNNLNNFNFSLTNSSLYLNIDKSNNVTFLGKKTLNGNNNNNNNNNISLSKEQEIKFKELMKENNFEIKEVSGDGNCLFRAISDQVYGSDEYHEKIREMCMNYLTVQKKFFQFFIEGDFDEYIKEKSKSGVWGDDIELEALSEIYNRPIEIYSGTAVPIKCFHEDNKKFLYKEGIISVPIRLSYHGKKHYNSVIPLKDDEYKYKLYKNSLISGKPGIYEKKIIAIAKDNEERFDKGLQISENEYMDKLKKNLSGIKNEEILDKIILKLNKSDSNDNKQLENDNKNKKLKTDKDKEIIDKKSNLNENEEINDNNKKEEKENIVKNKSNDKSEDLSIYDYYYSNPVVQSALELGFNLDEIVQAISICGDDNKEILINYLLGSKKE